MAFFVVEGIDGSGKSSLLARIADAWSRRGIDVVCLREPGSTALGEGVRRWLLDPNSGDASAWTEAALFTAARAELIRLEVRPALDRGATVLLDRYYHSTLAYQGFGSGADVALLQAISLAAVGGLEPDLVVLLDVPTPVAELRRKQVPDRMEQKGSSFLERVRAGYLELARRDASRFAVVDGTQSRDDVFAAALPLLDRRLPGLHR